MGGNVSYLSERRYGNSGSSCWLCGVLCCPPLPSRIAAKLAFMPPEPTYHFVKDEDDKDTLVIKPTCENGCEVKIADEIKQRIKVATEGTDPCKIATMLVQCYPYRKANHCLLYSPGNAKDLGGKLPDYLYLGQKLSCDIFSYDYPGYGESSEQPSSSLLYKSIEIAYNALTTTHGYDPDQIILYGESLGSVPTMDLAVKYRVAGVVLHAPLLSAMRMIFRADREKYCCDVFDSSSKVELIQSPILVIQGTEDEIINHSHGQIIHQKSRNKVAPLFLDGCNHNFCHLYPQYIPRLRQFINYELKSVKIQTYSRRCTAAEVS